MDVIPLSAPSFVDVDAAADAKISVGLDESSAHGLRQMLRSTMSAVLPRTRFITRGRKESRRIFLTFDDGPHPEHTPRLLDVLAEEGFKATFFVVGQQAERYPQIIGRMAKEGHDVGNHTFHHAGPDGVSAAQLMNEVTLTMDVVEGITGRAPTLFRPPRGQLTIAKMLALWSAGQTVVLLSVDPKDSERTPPPITHWFAHRRLEGGDIVLMHDDQPHAAAVIPHLAAEVRKTGLILGTVSEAVQS